LRFLQLALSCVTEAEWVIGPAPHGGADRALVSSEDPIRLRRQRGLSTLLFVPSQRFEIVEDDRYEGEWKVRMLAYIYRVYIDSRWLAERVEVMGWHWHPLRTPDHVEPHVHVRVNHPLLGLALRKLHIPTGRVSFEEVVRFLRGKTSFAFPISRLAGVATPPLGRRRRKLLAGVAVSLELREVFRRWAGARWLFRPGVRLHEE
jgi:hypothetical protein